jgi:hypothetical protein
MTILQDRRNDEMHIVARMSEATSGNERHAGRIVIASASEAIHLAAKKEWIASSLPLLAMTSIPDVRPHSRGAMRPGYA